MNFTSSVPLTHRLTAEEKSEMLDETTFTEALDTIIQRNYFPNLARMKLQVAAGKAVARGDIDALQQARCAAMVAESGIVGDGEQVVDVSQMSIDDFVKKYSSEDNESFKALLTKERLEKRKRHAWLYEGESQQLLLEAPPSSSSGGNLLMLPPPPRAKRQKAELPPMIESAPVAPKKSVNYNATSFQGRQESIKDLTSFASKQLDGGVFQMMDSDHARLLQMKMLREHGDYDLADFMRTPQRAEGDEDPAPLTMMGNYELLATPRIQPGHGPDIITWGEMMATPQIIHADPEEYLSGPRFELSKQPIRERAGHRLADAAGKRMREENRSLLKRPQSVTRTGSAALTRGATPRPLSALSRGATPRPLTPAAQALAARMGKVQQSIFSTPRRSDTSSAPPTPRLHVNDL